MVAATTALTVGATAVNATSPGDDDPKATASTALARLIDEPFRFSADFTASMGGLSFDGTNFLSGEVAQPMVRAQLDLTSIQPILAGMIPDMPEAEWTAEAILAGDNVYVRGGLFALAAQDPDTAELAQLVDDWGRIDLAVAAGDELDDVPSIDELRMAVPFIIGFATGAETIGSRAGSDGSELTGIRLDYDIAELDDSFGGGSTDVPKVIIPLELWIDADGAPRELILDLDAETMAALMEASGESMGGLALELNLTVRFDNVGDTSIAIKEPTGATDITQTVVNS